MGRCDLGAGRLASGAADGVRDALGHASVARTNVYLSGVGAHEAVDAMRNREWRALQRVTFCAVRAAPRRSTTLQKRDSLSRFCR
jgi:hypothetical protein